MNAYELSVFYDGSELFPKPQFLRDKTVFTKSRESCRPVRVTPLWSPKTTFQNGQLGAGNLPGDTPLVPGGTVADSSLWYCSASYKAIETSIGKLRSELLAQKEQFLEVRSEATRLSEQQQEP